MVIFGICRCSGTGGTTVHLLLDRHGGSSTKDKGSSLHETGGLREGGVPREGSKT
jgi:hypothetical protein